MSGGNLTLTARREAFNGKSYSVGAVESLFDVPGETSYVEVRARALPREANVLSAIWLQSSPLTVANNPNPEIDIQETFDYRGLASTLHTWAIRPENPSPTTPDEYIHTQTPLNVFLPAWTSARTFMSTGWNEATRSFDSISTGNWPGKSRRQIPHS